MCAHLWEADQVTDRRRQQQIRWNRAEQVEPQPLQTVGLLQGYVIKSSMVRVGHEFVFSANFVERLDDGSINVLSIAHGMSHRAVCDMMDGTWQTHDPTPRTTRIHNFGFCSEGL